MRIEKRYWLATFAALLGLALTFGLVYAANLVRNGDFSALTGSQPDSWTPWPGDTIVADEIGACGLGVATIGGDGIATAQQCVAIKSPGLSWTFAADMAVLDGSASAARYIFYATSDCSGPELQSDVIGYAMSSTMEHYSDSFTYDTAANGANYVCQTKSDPLDNPKVYHLTLLTVL